MEHELDLDVLRSWIARYEKAEAQVEHERAARTPTVTEGVYIDIASAPSAFVPVASTAASPVTLPPTPSAQVPSMALSLYVRLSNGVEFDLGEASIDDLTTVIHVLGRAPGSGFDKDLGVYPSHLRDPYDRHTVMLK